MTDKRADFLENRLKDWEQIKYLAKHKKDVYTSGRELGAPRLQLLKHDWSKLKPSNWVPYRNYWFGEEGAYSKGSRDKVKKSLQKPFSSAASRHKATEKHHMHKHPDKAKRVELKKVPINIRKEMLSDWHSVSRRTSDNPDNFPDVKEWAKEKNLDWMYKKAKIVKEDGKFKLYNSKKTKVLGTHDSYEKALRQERAIWASKRASVAADVFLNGFDKVAEKHDLIFYSNRSTPQVVSKGAEGKKKKGYGKVTKRRAATDKEEKTISTGKWLRVDESGNKPSSDSYKKTKYRPQLVKDK